MGPTPVSRYSVFFFFSTQLTEANIIKKINKKKLNGQPRKRKEKKKKKKTQTANANPGKEKKKVKMWSKVVTVGPLCVFNYNITIEL